MPSWACISSKPRLTSSSVIRCETNGSTSISPASAALDELGHLVAALDAAEGGAGDAAAGDQVARDDVERLPLAGHAGDGAQAPAHARGLDGLAHDLRRCPSPRRCSRRRSRRSRRARAATVSSPPIQVSVAPWPRASVEPVLGEVDADDPLGALQARAGDGAEPDHAGAEDDDGRARLHLGGVHRRAEAGAEARRRTARRGRSGASGLIFASAISGITVYSANVLVPMKWRIGSPSRESRVVPSGRWPWFCSLADRQAEVRARAAAVLALAALGREERDDVVAGRDVA